MSRRRAIIGFGHGDSVVCDVRHVGFQALAKVDHDNSSSRYLEQSFAAKRPWINPTYIFPM